MSTSDAIPISYSPAPVAAAQRQRRSFVGHAQLIGLLTLLSRIFGILRETVAARYFGAGPVWSAFTVAFKIPNLFRKLFGEGALSVAFIPLYAQSLKRDDAEVANRFAADSVNMLLAALIYLTIAGEFALWIVAARWTRDADTLLTLKFTAIMLPYVLLICGAAFLGGILQVHHRFGLPAFSPILLNIIHIVVIVLGARFLLLKDADPVQKIEMQTKLAHWLAIFVLVAGVLQIAILLPALRAIGFRFVPPGRFWTPAVKKMVRLSIPVALGTGVLQLSVLIDTGLTVWLTRGADTTAVLHWFGKLIAYPMQPGAVARLNWAQFLYQFPLGIFAISLATAIFPGLSADALDADRDKFRRVLRHGILVTLMEGLPASLGLILVRYPAIRLVLQHGSFTADDTRWVALSVVFYSAAIWAFSLQQILNRAYYALHDTTTPMVMAIVTLLVNTVVEVPLVFTHLGEAGMAVGTLVSFALQAMVMLLMLDRRVGGLGLREISLSAVKMLLACGAMAAACWAATMIPGYPHGAGNLASLLQLIILMLVGAGTYAGVCSILGVSIRRVLFGDKNPTAAAAR
jgi:putative peptidoglycan lipid II flippase